MGNGDQGRGFTSAHVAQVKSIAILGPGAIGGFLAAILTRAGHNVTCIAREGVEFKNGIHLESAIFGNFRVFPRIVYRLDTEPDFILVTVKAPFLRESLRAIPKEQVKRAAMIPLLNGLGHAEVLRGDFGPRIAVGTIGRMEAQLEVPGQVKHLSPYPPHVEFASDKDIPRAALHEISAVLSGAGTSTAVLEREAEVIWRKLVRLNAIASVTAASQKPVGFVRNDPEWRKKLFGCVCEGAEIARREGAEIDPQEVMREIDALPAELSTSLQRDIAQGRPSELEAITGAVMRQAEKYHISCPFIREVYEGIKTKYSQLVFSSI